jgi:ATP-dependent Zn protease
MQKNSRMLTEDAPDGQGVRFQTVRVDSDVSAVLDQNGIEYTGKIQSNVLANLFSWIFPILIIVGFWYFIMKRFISSKFKNPNKVSYKRRLRPRASSLIKKRDSSKTDVECRLTSVELKNSCVFFI